jgi:hypothetical protein
MGRRWTEDEDVLLRQYIAQYGRQWSVIASHIPNRTPTQVAARWEKCINPVLTKGQFSAEEDQQIIDFVAEHGIHAWPKVTTVLPHRTSKQCRERWFNSLDPSVTKAPWTAEEDQIIFEEYVKKGPKWSLIAPAVPGRSDNAIKNRWNASISKRLFIGPDGQPELSTNKVRKYTKRNTGRQRPPPLLPPEDTVETTSTITKMLPSITITPTQFTPRGWFTPGFGEPTFDTFDSLRLDTPLHSPGFPTGRSLFSPTGFGADF